MAFTTSDSTGPIWVIGRGPHALSLAQAMSLYTDCICLSEISGSQDADPSADSAVDVHTASHIIYLPRTADDGIVREYISISDRLRLCTHWEGGLILLIAGGGQVERLRAQREFRVSGVCVADRYAGLACLTTLLHSVGTLRSRRWKELKDKWKSENAHLTNLLLAARRCHDGGDRDGFQTQLQAIISHLQNAGVCRTLEDETGHNSPVMKLVSMAEELSVSIDGWQPSPDVLSLLDNAYECLMTKTGGRR